MSYKLSIISGARGIAKLISERPFENPNDFMRFVLKTYNARGVLGIVTELLEYQQKSSSEGRKTVERASGVFVDLNEITTDNVPDISIGIHIHLYYADLAKDMARYVSRVPLPVSLYVSVATENAKLIAEEAFGHLDCCAALDVRIVQNRGRDIAPFVVEFSKEIRKHEIIAHIHSKKSLYNEGATGNWREYLLSSLFPDRQGIIKIIGLLSSKKYGLIYPQCFHDLPYIANTWLANYNTAITWSKRLGLSKVPYGYIDFPVGSMFWARVESILPLYEAGIKLEEFVEEAGQTDGTLAHCLERMLGILPLSRGHELGILRDSKNPSWSKWRFEQYTNRPNRRIANLIQSSQTKLVLFDIFETLITRPLLFGDRIKDILEARLAEKGIHGFKAVRINAEKKARIGTGSDVTLLEIYSVIEPADGWGPLNQIMQLEIEIEINAVSPRHAVIDLFRSALAANKRVALASDMFLPRDVIKRMLDDCGIVGWSEIYLSSDIGYRKDSGAMYQHIMKSEQLSPSEILMIGDNEHSDVQIPQDAGIKTAHIMRPAALLRSVPRFSRFIPSENLDDINAQIVFGVFSQKFYSDLTNREFQPNDITGNNPYKAGFMILGPAICSFSSWLIEEVRSNQIDTLHFLSREGKLLKSAFSLWAEGLPDLPECKYLLTSRRAITVPNIKNLDHIQLIAKSSNYLGGSADQFFRERFGIELSQTDWGFLEQKNIWLRRNRITIQHGDISEIRDLLAHFEHRIISSAVAEAAPMHVYLKSQFGDDTRRNAVVDVGYSATIQRNLVDFTGRKIDGLYLATDEDSQGPCQERGVFAKGCFVHATPKNLNAPIFYQQSFILEKMLSADDTQLIKFEGSGVPVYKEEIINEKTKLVRSEVQKGALDFVRAARDIRGRLHSNFRVPSGLATSLFEEFVGNLSADEQIMLSQIGLDDDYCGRGLVN
ncbi:HAD-IA family hydrolase [Pararhizobium sp. DWP3-4]|uniref:HAD-IA family hydrolase n=1 Tax=Pararhizobium sp. DWP3-4 TaxID=2804565 RepID=UPI003CF4DCCF